MTAEKVVKDRWPLAAVCRTTDGDWGIYVPSRYDRWPICRGRGDSRSKAWRDAARRIQRDPVEQEGK